MPDAEGQDLKAGDVVRDILRTTAAGVFDTEQAAIADEPDGVHQHRTRVRRLRSVLASFRDHLDEGAVRGLRVQFAEWGRDLGVVRDIEVRADVAARAMAELGIVDADLTRRLVTAEREEYLRAHARLRELHDAPRSAARTAALRDFVLDPPLTAAAEAAPQTLQTVARREAARLHRAAKRAAGGSLESLHAARKAGRRLRYVAEALHEASPDPFDGKLLAFVAAGEQVHDLLGDHRDEFVFVQRLERARARAARAGESLEHYDELIAQAHTRGRNALQHFRRTFRP